MMTVVDHAIGVEGELVLAQDAELPRTNYVALLRIELAGQHLHEGGFAGAVRSGEAVALPRRECCAHVFKQDFCAVAHGYVTYRDHDVFYFDEPENCGKCRRGEAQLTH